MPTVVLRLSWNFYADECTVFWFPGESESPSYLINGYVAKTLGQRLRGERIHIDATPDEVRSWSAAATAYVDECAAAARDLQSWKERAPSRRGRWRRSAERRLADAEALHVRRVEAARARYRPVLESVGQRVAEAERAMRAAEAEAAAERKRTIEAARARFAAWEQRQALAHRPLFDGRSARELAASGDTPSEWPPELDDPESWWAGVRTAVRNDTARAAAAQSIIDAVTTVAAALEEAGLPGITAIKDEPIEVVHGWWVEFDWSGLPGADALRVPPDIPVSHIPGGEWHYWLYLPARRILRPGASIASATTETLKNSIGTRHRWSFENAVGFADSLLPTMSYWNARGLFGDSVHVPMADHADPDAYVPYVRAVAARATAAFTALLAGEGGGAAP